MRSGAGEIPESVLFEILARLPVKSLRRFRSVCTSWLSLISDPYFIGLQYAVSRNRPKLLLLDTHSRPSWELLIYGEDQPEPVEAVSLPSGGASRVVPSRSVHGLVCFARGNDDIVVLNPSTREHISLHPPQPTWTSIPYIYKCFGFDPISDKHKVLHSFAGFGSTTRSRIVIEHWVLTLGGAEKWRSIGFSSFHLKSEDCGEVCINGVVYFLAMSAVPCLAAFDLKSESFQIAKPSGSRRMPLLQLGSSYTLTELNGSVALVNNRILDNDSRIDVWVLEDFRQQVWALKTFISPSDWSTRIISSRGLLHQACVLRGSGLLSFTPFGKNPAGSEMLLCTTGRSIWCSDHVESLLPLKGL